MVDPFWPDVGRYAAIASLMLCIGGMVSVFRLHWRATRIAPRDVGLLPWHVAAVSLAVLLRDVPLVWGISATIGQPATPEFLVRLGTYIAAAVVLLVALGILVRTQRRRIRFGRSETRTVLVESSQRTALDGDPD